MKFDNGLAALVAPGLGPRLLWIHGYTINSRMWGEIWRLLPDYYHIGVDLPGHGHSDPWPTSPSLPELAKSFGSLAISQGVEHIVGLSFGTAIALQVIIEYPDAFKSLTLGAPALGGGPLHPPIGLRYRELMGLYRQRGAGPWMTELWMKAPSDIFDSAANHPQLWQQLIEVINEHTWDELTTGAMRDLPFYPQTMEMLQQISIPVLTLLGDKEMPAFKRTSDMLLENIPNCKRVYLSETGHLCMLERPAISSEIIDEHLQVKSER